MFTTQYTHDYARSNEFGTDNTEPSLTQQSDAVSADINVIMRRYTKTGVLPPAKNPAQFGDFSQITDFRTALDQIREAQEAFSALPSRIRSRFQNNAAAFVEFAANPDNLDELKKLDLLPTQKTDTTNTEGTIPTPKDEQ